jgi:hypothetical protein
MPRGQRNAANRAAKFAICVRATAFAGGARASQRISSSATATDRSARWHWRVPINAGLDYELDKVPAWTARVTKWRCGHRQLKFRMGELETTTIIGIGGFAIGLVFGAVVQRTSHGTRLRHWSGYYGGVDTAAGDVIAVLSILGGGYLGIKCLEVGSFGGAIRAVLARS